MFSRRPNIQNLISSISTVRQAAKAAACKAKNTMPNMAALCGPPMAIHYRSKREPKERAEGHDMKKMGSVPAGVLPWLY
jgi:hypothetical protein